MDGCVAFSVAVAVAVAESVAEAVAEAEINPSTTSPPLSLTSIQQSATNNQPASGNVMKRIILAVQTVTVMEKIETISMR